MKISSKLRMCICSALLLSQFSWSKAKSSECPKLSEPLCADVKAKSNEDTVWVNIILRASVTASHDSCLYSNPNKYPDSNCVDKTDSAFWAKLKRDAEEAYAKYSSVMMDARHPSQSLPYPGDSAGIFYGVIVTKSNLYAIVQDTLTLAAELYFYPHTDRLGKPLSTRYSGRLNERGLNFSVNGRIQSRWDAGDPGEHSRITP